MKYKINEQKQDFEPFTVQITVENLAELKSLWARFNCGAEWGQTEPEANGAYMRCYALWSEIDEKLKKYL